MKLDKLTFGLTTALMLAAAPLAAQSTGETVAETAPEVAADGEMCNFLTCALADLRIGNPIDPSTWWDGSEGTEHEHMLAELQPMDPATWMMIPNPETHSRVHMTMTNPEGWAQFMKPGTYIDMLSTDNLANLIDLDTYDVLVDPQTYAYWAQPGAYGHVFNVEHYAQLLNPQAYMNMATDVVGAWMGLIDG